MKSDNHSKSTGTLDETSDINLKEDDKIRLKEAEQEAERQKERKKKEKKEQERATKEYLKGESSFID
jgi:hypothetical protein